MWQINFILNNNYIVYWIAIMFFFIFIWRFYKFFKFLFSGWLKFMTGNSKLNDAFICKLSWTKTYSCCCCFKFCFKCLEIQRAKKTRKCFIFCSCFWRNVCDFKLSRVFKTITKTTDFSQKKAFNALSAHVYIVFVIQKHS